MAGHFILTSITHSDCVTAQGPPLNAQWSPLQHADVGWTEQSRNVLKTALAGGDIGNRDGLPPHRYLVIGAVQANSSEWKYLRGCGWAEKLRRPNAAGLGLRQLTPQAQFAFNGGNLNSALTLQAQHGNVAIEIYYLSGSEIS